MWCADSRKDISLTHDVTIRLLGLMAHFEPERHETWKPWLLNNLLTLKWYYELYLLRTLLPFVLNYSTRWQTNNNVLALWSWHLMCYFAKVSLLIVEITLPLLPTNCYNFWYIYTIGNRQMELAHKNTVWVTALPCKILMTSLFVIRVHLYQAVDLLLW